MPLFLYLTIWNFYYLSHLRLHSLIILKPAAAGDERRGVDGQTLRTRHKKKHVYLRRFILFAVLSSVLICSLLLLLCYVGLLSYTTIQLDATRRAPYIYIYTHTERGIYIYIYMYICIYTCVYAYVYIYIYIYCTGDLRQEERRLPRPEGEEEGSTNQPYDVLLLKRQSCMSWIADG